MDKAELLKVLDMSEQEQVFWFYRRPEKELHGIVWISPKSQFKSYRLADLAFRLRDGVIDDEGYEDWENATAEVYQKAKTEDDDICDWWMDIAKPIHWIIAALIAKGA